MQFFSEYQDFFEAKDWASELNDPWGNLVREYPKLAQNKDVNMLRDWYGKMVNTLPEYSLEKTTLENADWSTVFAATGEDKGKLSAIKRADSAFFTLEAVRCKKTMSDGREIWWDQPVLVCKEAPLKMKIFGKEAEKPIYGVLAVVRDTEGNCLVTVGQEATSENEKHAVIRLPVQASAGKIALMAVGKASEPGIEELMRSFNCDSIAKLIEKAELVVLEAPEDPDRIIKHNVIMVMPKVEVTSDLHKQLESNGSRIWASREQWDALVYAGLANSHTVLGVDASERADRMQRYK